MRPRIVIILTIALSLYNSALSFGQSVSEKTGPPPPNNQQRGPNLPIDDNITILLIVGLLLGTYFLIKKYRAKDTPA